MTQIIQTTAKLFADYGYAALFATVLAEQLGLPLPAAPCLLAAGALAGLGGLNPALALLLAVAASVLGDTVWYYLGRLRGVTVLRLLCRISLEPESCVRQTTAAYSRHATRWLLFAKFVPGVSTVAPPMAGIYGMNLGRFLLLDGAGASLWAGAYLLSGWAFSTELQTMIGHLGQLSSWLGWTLAAAALGGILYRLAAIRGRRPLPLNS